MEQRERFVIEVLLAATFIVFLILLVFLATGVSGKTQSTIISNSYNTNIQATPSYSSYSPYSSYRSPTIKSISYTSPYRSSSYSYSKPYIVQNRYSDTARIYYVRDDLRYTKSYDQYLRYDDWGKRKRVKGIFGNDIDRYEVNVRNRDYTGGYFKVNFYFEDYYGKISQDSMTRYIRAKESSDFLFKDISADRYKYQRWWYEVTSQTKAPTKVYYNTNSPRTIYAR